MVDETRKREMKRYQRLRTEGRRARGLSSRTVWIRQDDVEEFQKATSIFIDHARLIEGVTGGTAMSAKEIIEIVAQHNLPYTPDDLIFLSRVGEELSLRPAEWKQIEERAKTILSKYRIPVTFEALHAK